ncbi:MAG: aminomethyl-transferring glycine dehydrogenase subunit GcvPA [Pleurocapsa sp. SU_196_0]|nr:aminomethyl-transferring glycine dehydrogenase subunit GcvPA [Pleurocapsa sp. SU_196_0]
MNYTPHTREDIQTMLETIGASSVDALFDDLPLEIRDPKIDIPGLDERGVLEHMKALAAKNRNLEVMPSFLGGGMRHHFQPSVVDALTFQSEFVTAYTPYQPEVSQGELQAMFEYQSMIAALTGLEVSNSSLYDGATGVAEAALLAMRQTNRSTVLVSRGVHPEYRETLTTFLECVGAKMIVLELDGTRSPAQSVEPDVAAVIVQNPNFLGSLEDMRALSTSAHEAGALFIAVVDPMSLAVIQCPAEYDADIAVGDGQVIGNAPNFGGPAYGFIAVKENLTRQLPGRIVGATRDVDGRRGFALTLQAREQHIRRAKAKSNICSNHALMALQSAVYLSSLGPVGLREVAIASAVMAGKLEATLRGLGLELVTTGKFLNEFVVRLPKPALEVRAMLAAHGVHACVPVPLEYGFGDAGLFAATELTTDADIARLETVLRQIME